MTDRNILKLKLGLAIAAIVFLLIGSKLLFSYWTSIHWTFWLLAFLVAYRGVYTTIRTLSDRNETIVYKGFATVETATWVLAIALATAMFFIFYPLISLIFYGLTFISLSIYSGLEFKEIKD
ncbi:hypothetical protein [Fulvivirga lutimaris]|uniref:hypothetical protein n=1 Tax=Fulvivirga lutimaris TaxID=1819566 RepID=UPI0012BD7197|nr:hypothetical protein [Fulvivirga lutimaris]MTI39290.1 hypothetical protein [Fulvivirga lutimaris]